uniref:Cysteine rich secreted protein n=1 Tax=Riptortus pedestris TaxID=329032 RepID=R4WCM7_RIPPE|nr:cysteine rich secreted protein [Riptortus pedestris]
MLLILLILSLLSSVISRPDRLKTEACGRGRTCKDGYYCCNDFRHFCCPLQMDCCIGSTMNYCCTHNPEGGQIVGKSVLKRPFSYERGIPSMI